MIDPIFLAEAVINGILLGGVLALLALGLNLIFGVIDIVWIAYVDLVMLCMYGVYFLVQVYGWPLWLAGLAAIGLGALLGVARAPAHHHAHPREPADQPAPRHRRAALLHPVVRHLAVDHRPPLGARDAAAPSRSGGIFISFTRLHRLRARRSWP